MADEKPKAPTGADIMAAIESHRAESRANDAAILKALESIMAKQAEQDATLAAIRNTVNQAPAPSNAPRTAPASNGEFGGGSGIFPNYGRGKGQPIAGAEMGDLEYYAAGCKRTLADPNKSRWHEKERALLAAIEAEIARQRGGATQHPDPSDSWGSAPTNDPPPFYDERPPPDDEPLF